jgi:hypothetical protein
MGRQATFVQFVQSRAMGSTQLRICSSLVLLPSALSSLLWDGMRMGDTNLTISGSAGD